MPRPQGADNIFLPEKKFNEKVQTWHVSKPSALPLSPQARARAAAFPRPQLASLVKPRQWHTSEKVKAYLKPSSKSCSTTRTSLQPFQSLSARAPALAQSGSTVGFRCALVYPANLGPGHPLAPPSDSGLYGSTKTHNRFSKKAQAVYLNCTALHKL